MQRSSTGQGPWEAYLVPLGPDQQPRKVAIGSASSAVLAAIMVATALAQLGYRYTPDDSSKQLVLEDEGLIAEVSRRLLWMHSSLPCAVAQCFVAVHMLQGIYKVTQHSHGTAVQGADDSCVTSSSLLLKCRFMHC